MNEPKQLMIQENQTFVGEMEKGKIQVIDYSNSKRTFCKSRS